MNTTQRTILAIGLLACAACAIYPPWYQSVDGIRAMLGLRYPLWDSPYGSIDMRLDWSRLLAEIATISFASLGLSLFAARWSDHPVKSA